MSTNLDALELAVLLEKEHSANLILLQDVFAFTTSHLHRSFVGASITFAQPKKSITRRFPYSHVLNASYDSASGALIVRLLEENQKTKLPFIEATVAPEHSNAAQDWVKELMYRAYGQVKPYKRLKVLLNPSVFLSSNTSCLSKFS